jgi:hypothetical protein
VLPKTVIAKVDSTPISSVSAQRNVELMKSITLLLKIVNAFKDWVKLTEPVKYVPPVQLPHQMDLHVQAAEITPFKSMVNASVNKDLPIIRPKFVLLALSSPMLS